MLRMKTKLWVGVGAFVLSGSQITGFDANKLPNFSISKAFAASDKPHVGHGNEGGEGGESGGRKSRNAAERKIDFLKNLSLVEGHLIAGHALYKAGAKDGAKTHMKHPSDELYGKLAPGFKEFSAPRFDSSLERMASAIEQGESLAKIEAAFQAVLADIERARGKTQPTVKTHLLTASYVVREAGAEFFDGVKDGKVVNAHEYQDAYGFVEAGKRLIDSARSTTAEQKKAVAQARQALNKLNGSWPTLTGDGPITTTAAGVHAIASQIELAASSLNQ